MATGNNEETDAVCEGSIDAVCEGNIDAVCEGNIDAVAEEVECHLHMLDLYMGIANELQYAAGCSSLSSNDELLDLLLTSTHEPLVSDGTCTTWFRGHRYWDGGLRKPVPSIPNMLFTVNIYPVPNRLLRRVWPYRLLSHPPAPEDIAISPGEYRPWPLMK
eukprot:gene9470-9635_t